jgi:glycosyltransferase involved in cell wall biosynthesis
MSDQEGSVLFVHHSDLTSPFKSTVPYYVPARIAESRAVHVLCRKHASQRDEADQAPEGVELHDLDTGEIPIVSGVLFFVLSTLYALVLGARWRYDAVYAFQGDLIQGWVASRAAGARFVVGLQSVPVRQHRDFLDSREEQLPLLDSLRLRLYFQYRRVIGALLERATAVTCLTAGIRDVTEEAYDVDLSDAHVIGMGIDTSNFVAEADGGTKVTGEANADSGDADTDRDGADGDVCRVAYVGTLSQVRGIGDLIDAIAAVDHDVEVVLAGTGADEQLSALRTRATELGVADRIEWLGVVPHEDVPRVLRRADIAVSPLSDIESYRISFPAKLLEYMACGCLVVATDIPAHRRVIEDGRNGFLYENGPTGLADALSNCIENGSSHDDVRREARATADQHSWDEIAKRHEAVLFE